MRYIVAALYSPEVTIYALVILAVTLIPKINVTRALIGYRLPSMLYPTNDSY